MSSPVRFSLWWKALSKAQRVVLVAAALAATLTVLRPSWIETYTTPQGSFARLDRGRHWVWDKPVDRTDLPSQGVQVHASERSATLMAIAGAAIALHFAFRQRHIRSC